jgi:hypothetical protein
MRLMKTETRNAMKTIFHPQSSIIAAALADLPLRIGWGEGSRVRCFPLVVILILLILSSSAPAATVVFTTNVTLTESDTTYDGQDIIVINATVSIDGSHAFNSLLLTNNAVLTHSACTASTAHRLDLLVTNQVIVSTNSRIDVSGKGYLPASPSGSASGGSYGGLGGDGHYTGKPTDVANPVYGDYADPEEWGSGGGGGYAGGGLVRLAAGTLHLEGQIFANGRDALYGGSSGGGICVAVSTLTGGGAIQANGGNNSNAGYGGGGGGRIAVYAGDYSQFSLTNVTAAGGTGNSPGGAGTVYVLQGTPRTHARFSVPGRVLVFPSNDYVFPLPCPFSDSIAIHFNKPIATNSISTDKFLIQGPMGAVVPTGISEVGDRLYRISFPPQTEQRAYRFTVLPTLLDKEGFRLDQNANGTPGES